MRIRPRHIPGQEHVPVEVHVLTTLPGQRFLDLSVDEYGATRGPIHRGHGPPFVAQLRKGRLRRSTDAGEQRQSLLPVVGQPPSHLSLFRRLHPERQPVAVTGCGNLGMNPGVLAALPDGVVGRKGPHGGVIEVLPDGSGRALERLPGTTQGFALSGPRLVREGQPQALQAQHFADPRHLLLFPYVEIRPGLRVDFGHDTLLNCETVDLYQRAVDGEVISLPLTQALPVNQEVDCAEQVVPVPPDELQEALAVKGYACEALQSDVMISLEFRRGIYPHHVLALRPDGTVCSVVVTGLGNRAGVHLAELAEDLAEGGFQDAILLDNGGDVGILRPQEKRFEVPPCEPERSESWPLTACLIFWEF